VFGRPFGGGSVATSATHGVVLTISSRHPGDTVIAVVTTLALPAAGAVHTASAMAHPPSTARRKSPECHEQRAPTGLGQRRVHGGCRDDGQPDRQTATHTRPPPRRPRPRQQLGAIGAKGLMDDERARQRVVAHVLELVRSLAASARRAARSRSPPRVCMVRTVAGFVPPLRAAIAEGDGETLSSRVKARATPGWPGWLPGTPTC
jgi:hypothetical protein